ncbi:hypothetical protein VPH35_029643 [Triticum aestivum]
MAEEPSAKRHHGETSDKSSNLDDVHVPGEKHAYTRMLKGVELHNKETLEIVCTSEPDKADEMISILRMKGGGFIEGDKMLNKSGLEINPNNFIDMQRKWKVPTTNKFYDSLVDVAASVIHPFYKGMKQNINKEEDHKLWGTSPLPDNLIEYA